MRTVLPSRLRFRTGRGVLAVVAAIAVAAVAAGTLPAAARAAGNGRAPAAISGHDFVARLDAARRLAEADAAHPSPQAMDAVRRAVGLPLDVVVAGGVVHLNGDDLLAGLGGTTAGDFHRADDHLSAMEDAAKAALAAQAPDPQKMGAALQGAFQGITTQPSVFERIRHDIWVFIVGIWQRLTHAVNRVPLPRGLLLLVLLGGVAGVLVVLIRRLRYVVPERKARGAGAGKQVRTDWDRLAREAMARGDLAGAVRARYGALLAALAARGIVPDKPSLTAGECRRAVAGDLPDLYPAVAKATTIFESVMYGRAPATAGEVDTLAAAERSVKAR
ncbi:MAG TPA: DUF4129 domain-containing protein [Actinomycetota bacterium]|nr:DUF4129 domain-containing protein [Actinomycetota bacterium]